MIDILVGIGVGLLAVMLLIVLGCLTITCVIQVWRDMQ